MYYLQPYDMALLSLLQVPSVPRNPRKKYINIFYQYIRCMTGASLSHRLLDYGFAPSALNLSIWIMAVEQATVDVTKLDTIQKLLASST